MKQDKKGHIRFLYYHKNQTISQIARDEGLARKTVRNALCDKAPAERKKRPSKLDPFKVEIERIIDDNPKMNQTLILQKIREKGYDGGKTILNDYILSLRREKNKLNRAAYLNLETLPGAEGQVDWAHCGSISCGQHKRNLYLFCMVLSYSRIFYMRFTTSMDMDTFLSCHKSAFRFFAGLSGNTTGLSQTTSFQPDRYAATGVPKSLLYDNLKCVVKGRYANSVTYNSRFIDFANFYRFRIKVCNVRAAHEKGKVERAIQYIKNNFLAAKEYENFDRIKAEGSLWLRHKANRRTHSVTRKIPFEHFLTEEKYHLLPLPKTEYDCAEPHPVRASKDGLVNFETNRYSVPSDYSGQWLVIKAYDREIKICSGQKEIASHRRSFDKHALFKQPAHYAKIIEQKKKAKANHRLLSFCRMSPEANSYLKGLCAEKSNVEFHIKKIMELEMIFGKTAVAGAIAHALSFKAFHWEYIKNILLNSANAGAALNSSVNKDTLMNIDIDEPDLSLYDQVEKGK